MFLYYIIFLYTIYPKNALILQICNLCACNSDVKEQKAFVRGKDLAKHFMNSGAL